MSALDAHQHADLLLLFRAAYVGGRSREHQVRGVLLDHAVCNIYEVERAASRAALDDIVLTNPFGRRKLAVNVDGEELARHARLLEARDVRVVLPRRGRADVVVFVNHDRRDVVVPVNDDRFAVQRERALPEPLVARGRCARLRRGGGGLRARRALVSGTRERGSDEREHQKREREGAERKFL